MREGSGKAHLRVTPLSCFFFFSCFFSFFKKKVSHCQHLHQSLTVSSVVGAPWRCGVLTTSGEIAGIGLVHLLGREPDSTLQSGWRLLAC